MTEGGAGPYAAVMQDRYTGDAGDFGKYGLLRRLRGLDDPTLRLGVIWYRTGKSIVESDSTNDGKYTTYLLGENERLYRPCDPPLYDRLRQIALPGPRSDRRVQAVEQSGLLGPDARFHSEYLPGPDKKASQQERQEVVAQRRRWVQTARRNTADCDILFLDPDNGLEIPSEPMTRFNAPKYTYLEEVQQFFGRGQSLVIYQHRNHEGTKETQFASRREQLQQLLDPADIFALYFSARIFIVLAASTHAEVLADRVLALVDSAWGKHFELIS